MATKSMLKNITIKSKDLAKQMVLALEHAQKKSSIKVEYSKPYKEISGEQIKELFKGQ